MIPYCRARISNHYIFKIPNGKRGKTVRFSTHKKFYIRMDRISYSFFHWARGYFNHILWDYWNIFQSIWSTISKFKSTSSSIRRSLENRPNNINPSFVSTRIQVFNESKRRAIWNKDSSNSRKPKKTDKLSIKESLEMPIFTLPKNTKASSSLQYPLNGKIKLFLEANSPIDIFIAPNQDIEQKIIGRPSKLEGLEENNIPELPGVLALINRNKVEDIITLPESWKSREWYLIIGNPNEETIAIYYQVYDVPK